MVRGIERFVEAPNPVSLINVTTMLDRKVFQLQVA